MLSRQCRQCQHRGTPQSPEFSLSTRHKTADWSTHAKYRANLPETSAWKGRRGPVSYHGNVSTGKEHALKQAHNKARFSKSRWLTERDILGKLSHKRIVKLLSVDPRLDQICLEYIPGGSLDKLDNITVSQSVSVLRQILSALTCLHGTSPRIVHRDIKPANILVREHTSHGITVVLGDIFRQEDSSVHFTPNTREAAAMLGEELNDEPSTSQITLQATPRYLTPAATWSTSGKHPGPHRSPLPNSSSQIVKGEQDGDKSLPSSARLSPSLYPSARTSLRRPVEDVALQGRSSKRQDRGSTSQLPGYSGAPLSDTE
ncbi:hypothetical protein J3458_016166 [Metarhizium acridum]|uniref:uncharacterized protein n=1 Tax=Metarhizium acridum TaxID=92637 RepID=UPI001C6C8BE9|nr:hypothetical protein J3458_021514 [Metarhizium acridum]KAG8411055.1 hypothetical protein J3458_016166 [Metarhizium acridum]